MPFAKKCGFLCGVGKFMISRLTQLFKTTQNAAQNEPVLKNFRFCLDFTSDFDDTQSKLNRRKMAITEKEAKTLAKKHAKLVSQFLDCL
jgi:fructose-1-phosphate kinase PfkB-like protein